MTVDVDHEQAGPRGGVAEVPAVRMEAVYKHYGDFAALTEIAGRLWLSLCIVTWRCCACRRP